MMIIFYQMRALHFEELFFVKNIQKGGATMRPMREKMHTGELYLPNDDEIFQDQIRKLDRLYDFNMTRPTQLDKRNAERDVCGDW